MASQAGAIDGCDGKRAHKFKSLCGKYPITIHAQPPPQCFSHLSKRPTWLFNNKYNLDYTGNYKVNIEETSSCVLGIQHTTLYSNVENSSTNSGFVCFDCTSSELWCASTSNDLDAKSQTKIPQMLRFTSPKSRYQIWREAF